MAHTAEKLAEIPLIDLGAGGPLALLDRERARAQALLAAGRRRHGRIVLRLGDRLSRTWLERAANPFRAEILDVARAIGHPGAVLLNLSYEWGCTTGAAPDPSGQGSRMLRVLDWPLDGLGRHVVVARQAGAHGPYYNVTWPGSVGVLTAMAPGRFSAAINQAPMARHGLTLVGDWTKNRIAVWHSRELPPAHLMRRVFETARDYAEAKAMLAQTPLAMPVLFTLSGVEPAEGCIIERFADRTRITEGAAADGRVCAPINGCRPVSAGRADRITPSAWQPWPPSATRRSPILPGSRRRSSTRRPGWPSRPMPGPAGSPSSASSASARLPRNFAFFTRG
ncbi:MAG: hypothetical protein HY057_03860 [Rhodospirillales bacterium]|nr:hypothetical protein [Rhodospirillales bacterium]